MEHHSKPLGTYKIFLIGFMGSGKSAISDYLCQNYGLEKIEMDQLRKRRHADYRDFRPARRSIFSESGDGAARGTAGQRQCRHILRRRNANAGKQCS